jgi:hypothetical protein
VLRIALLALLAACGNAPEPRAQSFEPGSQIVRGDRVDVELVTAQHEERSLRLLVAITNRARAPLEVGRGGLLLAYQELEFPVDASVPNSITIPSGERVELVLAFATPIAARSILRVRALERSGALLDGVALPIPAPQGNGP